ncbi:MAG: SDR family NAD(P)-dependent oxidoreductase [Saprospiraceae bacterium]|nr:SDR family NAD(P)-dependent oxidoreductase [Saprospiraceae bacterium]
MNKNALITGASSGIGLELCSHLCAKNKTDLVLVARSEKSPQGTCFPSRK